MLIVVPIAILVIAGLVSAMVAMVSDALVTNSTSTVTYDSQDTLSRIEQDARVSINFMGTLTNLTSPQGKDDNTAAFQSSASDLILTQQSTTSSPYESTRSLVYYKDQPNTCGVSATTSNRVLLNRVVYFLKTNGDGTKTLWRRTIINPANTSGTTDANTICNTPWQRNSCSPGATLNSAVGSSCQAFDERMIDNVSTFTTTYYTDTGATTTDPTQAITIQVQLSITKTVAGKTITQTNTSRVTRSNDVAAPSAPSTPTISIFNPLSTDYNNPILSTFQWTAPFATYYTVETKVGTGSWSSPQYTTNTSLSLSAPYAKTTLSIRVTAYNDYNQSAQNTYTGDTALWSSCSLQNGWENFPGYGDLQFTMTPAKVVEVRGLVRYGSSNTTVCTLPNGFKPAATLVFPTLTDGGTYGVSARVDIDNNGNINSKSITNWLSLSGIDFIPSGSGYTWTNFSLQNGWANSANSAMTKLSYTTDSVGRTQIQGVTDAGTTSDTTVIGQTLPSGLRPSEYYHLPAAGSGTANAVGLNGPAGTIVAKGDATSYSAIQQMFYPSSMTGWSNITMSNNWAAYSASTYTQPQYRKASDGIVTVKGLIKKTSGTPTLWEKIGQLGAGMCPASEMTFNLDTYSPTAPTNGTARINFKTDGGIYYIVGSTTWTSLDNIKFYADGSC
jgi:hypothetical protein